MEIRQSRTLPANEKGILRKKTKNIYLRKVMNTTTKTKKQFVKNEKNPLSVSVVVLIEKVILENMREVKNTYDTQTKTLVSK